MGYVITQEGPAGPASKRIVRWWLEGTTLAGMFCPSWGTVPSRALVLPTKREAERIARQVKGTVRKDH